MQNENVCSVLDASIDWFTATFEEGLKSNFAEAKSRHHLAEQEALGHTRLPANRFGYTGESCGGFFFGVRDGSALVTLSGGSAPSRWDFYAGLCTNVTRLDLAVTLIDGRLSRDWTKIALKQIRGTEKVQSGYLKTSRIDGTPNGSTLYIGRRSSGRFIRIYDKSAESPGQYPDRAWRWEIEYKRPLAMVQTTRLLRDGFDAHSIIEALASQLHYIGLELPCEAPRHGWHPIAPQRVTDDETRLAYVAKTVGPFIQRLIDSVGEERVKEALSTVGRRSPMALRPKKSRRLH